MGSLLDDEQVSVADRLASQNVSRDELVVLAGLQLDELIRIRIAVEQLADKAHGIRVPDWLRRK